MEELLLVGRGSPAALDDELEPVVRGIRRGLAQGTDESWIELGYTRNPVIEDRRAVRDGTVGLAKRTTATVGGGTASLARRIRTLAWEDVDGLCRCRGRGRRPLMADGCGDRRHDDEQAGDPSPADPNPTGRSCWCGVRHASIQRGVVLPACMRFSICGRYARARSIEACAC